MHITPDIVEGVYNLLLTTPPFNRWKLPDADDVVFIVIRDPNRSGDHYFKNGRHHIGISFRSHTTLQTLIMTVAHEMCHMKDHPAKAAHGASFRRLADRVCKAHGFDRGQF